MGFSWRIEGGFAGGEFLMHKAYGSRDFLEELIPSGGILWFFRYDSFTNLVCMSIERSFDQY